MGPYSATIWLFAANYAPEGWLFCEGQALPIVQYAALFSLLGTTYGGDGNETFKLPDLRDAIPGGAESGLHYIMCLSGEWPVRPSS
ncbi:MAG: phage tail protein [Candidatus Eremiobacteraeota bacterium]|nr:phage tail protein [Candidatus Eremiobacteraeota bacterium]